MDKALIILGIAVVVAGFLALSFELMIADRAQARRDRALKKRAREIEEERKWEGAA